VDFQTIAVGNSRGSNIDGNPALFNSGAAPLTITSIVASPSVFAYSPDTSFCPDTIPPGTGCDIDVIFTPTGIGTFNGTLTITDNAPGSPHIINLTGTGVSPSGPVPDFQRRIMNFGKWAVGKTSNGIGTQIANLGMNVANPGAASLTFTSIVATPSVFSVSSNNCPSSPSSLAPGVACEVGVQFTPTAAGVVTGTLTITDNATATPQVVPLVGTGVSTTGPVFSGFFGGAVIAGPTWSLFAPYINAPSGQLVEIGTTIAPSNNFGNFENSGSAPLIISSMVVSPGFAILTNCPNTLAPGPPGLGCQIYPSFTPTASGKIAGSLTITDNAADSPQTIILAGRAGPPTGPIPSLSPRTLSFGAQAPGVVSAAQNITLTNTGTAALPITKIASFALNEGTFAQTNDCPISTIANPVTLAVGANCTISVTFTSPVGGTFLGGVSILNDAGNPNVGEALETEEDVTAVGTASAPSFSVAASNSPATVTAGQSTNFTLTVTPSGGFNQSVSFACTGAPSQATCNVNPPSVTLDGTHTATTTVSVTTTAHSLSFRNLRPGSPPPFGEWLERGAPQLLMWLLLLAMLSALFAAPRRRSGLVLSVTLALALLFVACGGGGGGGGGGGNPGTPPGTYMLTVTATSGTAVVSTNLTLTVN